jgi:hypothetical protein
MTVGFAMLAHTALDRAAEVALTIAAEGCPVAIHVDRRTVMSDYLALAKVVASEPLVSLTPRLQCEWGTWSLVEASRKSAEQLLSRHPDVTHVMLISGSCIPIKPISELKAFLKAHPETDFIESVTVEDVPWTQGGLSEERFAFSFPFAWKRRRRLFDFWVDCQRRVGRRRRMPAGLEPHLGSQWWCITRASLERILTDPERAALDRYFHRVWIPDESYFQSMVRYYGTRVESRSLTLSKFDFQGKPHVFYDDHLSLLADSPAFFARKIWPRARRLYDVFLSGKPLARPKSPGAPGAFANRLFGEAVAQRTNGRAGLAMTGRFPRHGFENGVTAAPYAVFHGLGDVFVDFPRWIAQETGSCAHGHLFHPGRCQFVEEEPIWTGALSDSAALRDYDQAAFLRNLVWNTRGAHQSFLLSPRDKFVIGDLLARDANASAFVVTGAWVIPLLRSGQSVDAVRSEAARLQGIEAALVARLRERRSLAKTWIWTLADLLERPSEPLQAILDDLSGAETRTLSGLPEFRDLAGLPAFLQALRNSGMNPYLAGEVTVLPLPKDRDPAANVVRLR